MEPLPPEPWQILQLDPTTATERDVKRAYARLIKEHRPDTNPAEFQQVREAYEYALHVLRQQPEEAPMVPVDLPSGDLPTLPEQPILELPDDFQAALADVQYSVANPMTSSLSASFAKLRNLALPQVPLLPAWEHALLQIFADQPQTLGKLLESEDIFRLLCYDCTDLANLAVEQWYLEGLTLRLAQLANRCDLIRPPLDNPAVVMLQMRLALVVAFVNLPVANRLTNAHYPKLPPNVRDWVMPRVENRMSIAKLFEMLPLETRRFWERRIFPEDNETVEWDLATVEPQYREITLRCPLSWPGYDLLREVIPPKVLQALRANGTTPGRIRSQSQDPPSGKTEPAFSAWFIRAVLVLAYLAYRGVDSCSSSTSDLDRENNRRMAENLSKSKDQPKDLLTLIRKRDTLKATLERMPEYRAWKLGNIKELPPKIEPMQQQLLLLNAEVERATSEAISRAKP
jgi:hypothetical protein